MRTGNPEQSVWYEERGVVSCGSGRGERKQGQEEEDGQRQGCAARATTRLRVREPERATSRGDRLSRRARVVLLECRAETVCPGGVSSHNMAAVVPEIRGLHVEEVKQVSSVVHCYRHVVIIIIILIS